MSTPITYRTGGDGYPVVFVTDAVYSFPLVRSIRNLLGRNGQNIEEFILVGLPPDPAVSSNTSRNRDYTPTDPTRGGALRPPGYSSAVYGEAAAYRDYLESDVFEFISTEYDADMDRKVFIGHSYGGLLGSYILLTKPQMFSAYILSSPSLWFDQRSIINIESEYSRSHSSLNARVMMYAGEYEGPGPTPRHFTSVDLAGDMQRFEKRLQKRGYEGFTIDSIVLPDEDHLTVYPAAVSRGLLWALPGRGPYRSG